MYIVLICSLLLALETDKYSGETNIDGLGKIAFPEGEWRLETRLKPSENNYNRDTFVFKRSDGGLERLTFQVIPPLHKLTIDSYWDSICMATSEGLPQRLVGNKNVHESAETLVSPFVMHKDKDRVFCKGMTCIYENDKDPNWMAHAFVCQVNDSFVICVHASTGVLSPTNSQSVYYDSEFSLKIGQ